MFCMNAPKLKSVKEGYVSDLVLRKFLHEYFDDETQNEYKLNNFDYNVKSMPMVKIIYRL